MVEVSSVVVDYRRATVTLLFLECFCFCNFAVTTIHRILPKRKLYDKKTTLFCEFVGDVFDIYRQCDPEGSTNQGK